MFLMESFDDPLLHHPLGTNFEVASFSRVCISVSRLLWELQDAIVTLPTLGSVAFHVDLYYKGEM